MSWSSDANVIDLSSPTANMYGCEPCPKCKSRYRQPIMKVLLLGEPAVLVIECPGCKVELHGTERYG
jgi:hypothetical protein